MLNEYLYLLVINYSNGDSSAYEFNSLEEAEKFIKEYDDLYFSFDIYQSVCVRTGLYGDV